MRIKRKAKPKVLALHILIEQKSEGIRAHCLEFDLVVSGKNSEQAMVRMENSVKLHLNYARDENSNPIHFADQSIHEKWFDRAPSQVKKSWILEVYFVSRKPSSQRKRSNALSPTFKRYEQSFDQLVCA